MARAATKKAPTKPNRCPVCDKTIKRSMKRHLQLHDPDTKNRYPCPYRDQGCNFASRQNSNLRSHIKSMHDKIKDIQCEHCDYLTGAMSSLIHHHNSHHPTLPRSSAKRSPSSREPKPTLPTEQTYFVEQYTPSDAPEMAPASQELAPLSFSQSDYDWFFQQISEQRMNQPMISYRDQHGQYRVEEPHVYGVTVDQIAPSSRYAYESPSTCWYSGSPASESSLESLGYPESSPSPPFYGEASPLAYAPSAYVLQGAAPWSNARYDL